MIVVCVHDAYIMGLVGYLCYGVCLWGAGQVRGHLLRIELRSPAYVVNIFSS